MYLYLSVLFNLALLGFFKYFNFFINNLSDLFELWGLDAFNIPLNVVLPLGISFYTFQVLSYPIDIHRGLIKSTDDFLDFALFVAFFPNLISGPIERARNLIPQIQTPRKITIQKCSEGAWLVFWGLFKKILVADNLAKLTAPIFSLPKTSSEFELLFAMFAFALQLYADFSGYSDIARGLGRFLGFELMQNFRTPFFAADLFDFWQRWHISLTTWIKEYVYYPLALKKFMNKQLATSIVILITWTTMGLWHGATIKFINWGIYHSILLIIYNKIRPFLYRLSQKSQIIVWIARICGTVLTFYLFSLGLLCFAMKTMTDVGLVLEGIFNLRPLISGRINWHMIFFYSFLVSPMLLIDYLQYRTDDEMIVFKLPLGIRVGIYYLCFYLIIFYGAFNAQKYFYFQF